ncbi:anti-sigma factor family protein [Microbulbifer hainanensis]|uniref:anti-sigma factor family protein n=1 Tax=Microbulbifer hainanensis TaxID=2735675 RepID=UPI0018667582|nr:anti-sigma factor [Microbulbifer hainanensis]
MKPTHEQLNAYLDGELTTAEHQQVEAYLREHPDVAATLEAWRADGAALKHALDTAPQPPNPALTPPAIRRRRAARQRHRFGLAAGLALALGLGAAGGWQARGSLYAAASPPMADAVEAYKLFAATADTPPPSQAQLADWFNRYFEGASPPPTLETYGLELVDARLMATQDGPAVVVLYRNGNRQTLLFYIRPPSPGGPSMPNGQRHDGDLMARYWSDGRFNYALVSRSNTPLVPGPELFGA